METTTTTKHPPTRLIFPILVEALDHFITEAAVHYLEKREFRIERPDVEQSESSS